MKLITVICTALMAFSLTACAQKLEKNGTDVPVC